MSKALTETDPLAAATLADGLHQARQRGLSGQMRSASEQVEKNQLGQAAQQQAGAARDLEELLSILSNRREQELARLVAKLREAEGELANLRQQQAGLRKKTREAEAIADPEKRKQQLQRLAREQKQLEEQAARLARRLERLQAQRAAGSASSAAGKMADASERDAQGDAAQAGEQADAAQKDLEEAQQQLAEQRRQAEADLAQEQLARLDESLKHLHERQRKLIQETQRLENLRATAGRLTRAQLSTVSDVARTQAGLSGETSQLAEKLAASEVIHLALAGAGTRMARAAELLELRETGAKAQGEQEAARVRLEQLMSAFKDQKSKKPPAEQGKGGGGGGGESGGGRGDGNLVLAQLKLLKLLQEDLNSRYRSAAAARDGDPQAAGETIAELAAEQGKLADLALKLSTPPEPAPEDNPEKLPDVRNDDASLDDALLEGLEMPAEDGQDQGEAPGVPAPDVPAPETDRQEPEAP
jgi:hypothetical protein